MNLLHTKRRTDCSGYTLAEVTVVALLLGLLSLIGMSLLVSTMKLSNQNAVTNLSNFRARQTFDHLCMKVRYALDDPLLITTSGTVVTSGSTAPGLLVKNFVSSPYIVKNADGTTGAIATSASSFTLEFRTANGMPPPGVGDWLAFQTATHPELEIAGVSALADSGSNQRRLVTTSGTIGEALLPANYYVVGYLYRREAYVFSSATNGTLLHYPRVSQGMLSISSSNSSVTYTTGTGWGAAANYVAMGQGFTQLNSSEYFTKSSTNSVSYYQLKAVARSSNHAEYTENIPAGRALTTMPVKATLWNVGD
jgi:type II secretory pathway pseudopilin PulG